MLPFESLTLGIEAPFLLVDYISRPVCNTKLEEYLGYCLIPSTRAQTALFIIGNGGEGKSRIGVAMNAIFGSAMLSGNFQRVELQPHQQAADE